LPRRLQIGASEKVAAERKVPDEVHSIPVAEKEVIEAQGKI
jgi:hypothetical protein